MTDYETQCITAPEDSTPGIDEELDQLLNNGVSRNTPFYDLINIDRVS